MQFKVIISRAMFVFNGIVKGKAQLETVRFLSDTVTSEKNDVLLVAEKGKIDFFLSGSTPLAKISGEQCHCLTAAARFFGHFPGGSDAIPIWFSVDSLEMENEVMMQPGTHPCIA